MANQTDSAELQKIIQYLLGKGKIFSMKDLANKLSLSSSTLSTYLNGRKPPSRPFLQKLKETFGVDFEHSETYDLMLDNENINTLFELIPLIPLLLRSKDEIISSQRSTISQLETQNKLLQEMLEKELPNLTAKKNTE